MIDKYSTVCAFEYFDSMWGHMHILVVEDQPDILRLLKKALEAADYVVHTSADGREAHALGLVNDYDVVLLDLGLPSMDGAAVLASWRASGRIMPVVLVTARDEARSVSAGLDTGADAYVTKPFDIELLIAQLSAVKNRIIASQTSALTFGEVRLDVHRGLVTCEGKPVRLTAAELQILRVLMQNSGRTLSKFQIVDEASSREQIDSNSLEVLIGRLRQKLGVSIVTTVRGVGYRHGEPRR